jgi:hypothetical protein
MLNYRILVDIVSQLISFFPVGVISNSWREE